MVFIPNVNVPFNTEVFFSPDKLPNADQIGARGNDHWRFSASDSEMCVSPTSHKWSLIGQESIHLTEQLSIV